MMQRITHPHVANNLLKFLIVLLLVFFERLFFVDKPTMACSFSSVSFIFLRKQTWVAQSAATRGLGQRFLASIAEALFFCGE